MSISNERMDQHIRDILWDLEVKGDTDMAEIVVRADAPVLLAAVKRLREALTITDEMVERAGKELNARGWTYRGIHEPPCWCEDCKQVCTEDARRILEAALGKKKEK